MMKKKNETTKLMCFDNAEFGEVRLTVLGDTPWFVGKDIAAGLGYSNPQKAIRDHVDQEDKTMNEKFTVMPVIFRYFNEVDSRRAALHLRPDEASRVQTDHRTGTPHSRVISAINIE